jgi:thymidylate synthase (FAD)
MGRIIVPEAEALLDKEIRVLDHGFVRLVDYMGGDPRIVQAARVSYGPGTKTFRDDAALIDYLMRHQHTSPFEHVVLELHCKMPIFVARQWIRHRTARVNEISGRYTVLKDEFYVPPPEQIRGQSSQNKQSRSEDELPPEVQQEVLELLIREQEAAYEAYQRLLKRGVARELARINLPLSVYTQWYWQMDLHNLFHFLRLRLDPHAQWEIRQYAEAIARIAKAVAPLAYAAFERHVLRACTLSEDEVEAVRAMVQGKDNPLQGSRRRELEEKLGLTGTAAAAAKPEHPQPSSATASAAPAPPPSPSSAPAPATPSSGPWRPSLSDEEINSLPLRWYEGPIHVVSDDAALTVCVEALNQEQLLGFDTESRPAFRPGETYPIALIQLATASAVYLIQVQKLSDLSPLWRVFESERIIKAGVALQQDLRKLRELRKFEPAGFVDIASMAARLGFRKTGARGLTAAVLGFRISKGAQRSNWARAELTPAQIRYAATDAWIARELYLALMRHATPHAQEATPG